MLFSMACLKSLRWALLLRSISFQYSSISLSHSSTIGRVAPAALRTLLNLYNPLVDRVLQRRENAGSRNTYLDGILDQQEKLQLTRHEIDLMVGNLLEGGSDTSSIMTIAFIQAMACYPKVQQEAQREIDASFSEDASPSWQDYARLPYVAMAVKETMRWRPVMPTGFPHANNKGMSCIHSIENMLTLVRNHDRWYDHPRK